MQNYTINNSGIFKELEKNQRQTKKDTIQKGMKKNESQKIKFSKSSQNKLTQNTNQKRYLLKTNFIVI